jgi:ribokinase
VIVRDVVVIGDVMLDVVVKPSIEFAPTSDTPSNVRLSRGGAAANVAEVLARAGHHVTYVGACGDDVAGKHFEDTLRDAGIDLALERLALSTGVVVALVDPDGQRAMMTDRGANSALGIAHVVQRLDHPFDHLHVSGYTLLDQNTTDVGRGAIARAIALGRTTSVDVSSVAPLIAMTPSAFMAAAVGAHTLFVNEEEALALSESDDITVAIHRLAHDFSEVVITRGERGAWARANGIDHRTASQSDEVFDTTGAGDAATGAYLAVRLREGSIDEALAAGMSAASFVVRGLGSRGQGRVEGSVS